MDLQPPDLRPQPRARGYADIDVQLKRRADLVPQLSRRARLRGLREGDAQCGHRTARHRARFRPGAGDGTLRRRARAGDEAQQLLLLQENYPQLKADANFRDLSAKLVDTEDHLQHARRFYNGAVNQYRNRLESFPMCSWRAPSASRRCLF